MCLNCSYMTTIRQSRRTFILKRKQYLYPIMKYFILNILQFLKRKCRVLLVIYAKYLLTKTRKMINRKKTKNERRIYVHFRNFRINPDSDGFK